MKMIVRGLVGICGLLALLVAAAVWFNPETAAARLGLSAMDGLGVASLRADLGGFFAAAGALSLAGAIADKARLLTAPLILVAVALCGRALSAALSGFEASMAPPMIVEAVLLAILALGRRMLAPA